MVVQIARSKQTNLPPFENCRENRKLHSGAVRIEQQPKSIFEFFGFFGYEESLGSRIRNPISDFPKETHPKGEGFR